MVKKAITWRAAVAMAALITGAGLFTTFLPQWPMTSIREEFDEFTYALLIYTGGQFLTTLAALKGVSNALARH